MCSNTNELLLLDCTLSFDKLHFQAEHLLAEVEGQKRPDVRHRIVGSLKGLYVWITLPSGRCEVACRDVWRRRRRRLRATLN